MFFRTQLKSVGVGGAVDMQGRQLAFIGYLPCKAGDWVYTDGTVIFGNSKPKGAPAIFDVEPSGIPVLSDDLRGYFTTQGKFKKYGLKGDGWIVNGKKNYAHDNGESDIIDVEIALDEDGKETGIYTVQKSFTRFADDDADFHYGFYQKVTNGIFAPMNFGRIAAVLPEDDFYDVEGFWSGFYRFSYQQRGVPSSYEDGYYPVFEDRIAGRSILLERCMFFLSSAILDYSSADDKLIKLCQLFIKKDGKIIRRVNLSDLLKSFEDTAKDEVDVFPKRESVKHLKSRAVLQNFKISSDGSWEALIEAEIWASNTFYNKVDSRNHNVYPTSVNTTPFHISSTISHNRLLLRVKSDNTVEKIFAWKFIYPLKLRDETFGGYYFGEFRETTVTLEGAWIVRIMSAEGRNPAGEDCYYTSIWRDYDSRLEDNGLEYDTPIKELNENFSFPVQDEFNATLLFDGSDDSNTNLFISESDLPKNIGETFWRFGGICDKDNNQVVVPILQDKTDAHKWNMSLTTLRGGKYLFGIHNDDARDVEGFLYKVDRDGNVEQVGDGLKNFRLRELKKISKAKK